MKLTKAIREVEEWNKRFKHIPEDDDAREEMWRYNKDFRTLAIELIDEELTELYDACFVGGQDYMEKRYDVDALDAICDILVTVFGLTAKAGLTELVEPAFKEVMRANWSKLGEDGEPEFYPNGKIAKSSQYVAPDLKQFFDEEDLLEEEDLDG